MLYKIEQIAPRNYQVQGPGIYAHEGVFDYETAQRVATLLCQAYVKGQESITASRAGAEMVRRAPKVISGDYDTDNIETPRAG